MARQTTKARVAQPQKRPALTSSQRQKIYRQRQVKRVRIMTAALTAIRDSDYPREVRDIAIDALKGIAE